MIVVVLVVELVLLVLVAIEVVVVMDVSAASTRAKFMHKAASTHMTREIPRQPLHCEMNRKRSA